MLAPSLRIKFRYVSRFTLFSSDFVKNGAALFLSPYPNPANFFLNPSPKQAHFFCNDSGGCKAGYRTLLEGMWLSDIGHMAEVRNVPHLACKVWVRSLFSLKRWGCVKYRITTDLFLSTQPMRTNSVLTPCEQGAVLSRYSQAPKVKKMRLWK